MPITPDQYSYPFDPTGTAPGNKVTGEVHVITQQNHRDYSFVIPNFAPFFAEGLTISFTDIEGNPVPLTEGVDYYFGHHFLAASRAVSKQVYGSISFITKDFKGTMSLGYQTLGGMWTYDQSYLNQLMSNIISNPRSASWDSIAELPALFPVIDHEWDLVDMVGLAEVVAGLYGIEQAIRDPEGTGTGGTSGSQLMSHILNYQNPHQTTKLQVGLGNVENFGIATQAESEIGVSDNKYTTPLLVKQAIAIQALVPLDAHTTRVDNPHNTTKTQVGLGNVEDYPIATTEEAQAGVALNSYMTPARVKEAIDAQAISALTSHTTNVNNPHNTTKAQVGLGNVENYAIASDVEAQAGTANNVYMTPLRVKEAIDTLANSGLTIHIEDNNNPHEVTKAQVGLGNVENFGVASLEEAQAGTATNVYMTPQLVKEAINSMASSDLALHALNLNNPHGTTKVHVGLGSVENYAVATQEEAEAGIIDTAYMTPLRVKEAITVTAVASINNHKTDYNNPHQTTKDHVGLSNVDNYATATLEEAQTGTATDKFVTPALVRATILAMGGGGSVGDHLIDYANPHQVTAMQVGTYDSAQIDQLLLGKLDAGATAANSTRFDNMTVAELTAQILSNKIANAVNADTLEGKTYTEIINSLTTGTVANSMRLENNTLLEVLQLAQAQTAANSLLFDGVSLLELYATVPGQSDVAQQVSFDGVPVLSGGSELYTELFRVPNTNPGDVQVIVSGGGTSQAGTDSYAYLIKTNVRDSSIDVINLLGIDSTLQFSVVNDAGTLSIWMRSELARQQVSITELSNQFAVWPDVTTRTYLGAEVPNNVTTVQPAGWAPVTEVNVLKALNLHAGRTDNPHAVTKTQVGLGNVDNYPTASLGEAQAGNADNRFMTALRVKDAITYLLGNVQNYGVATQVEAEEGTASDKYMTAQRVAQAITVQAITPLNTHVGLTNNPHAVTKSQVGLGSVDNYGTATQAEAETGTATNKFMTPLRTAQAITSKIGNDFNTMITELTTLFNGLTV